MQYQRYELGSYNLHMIKNNKFKTTTIRVNFRRKLKKEEVNYRNLISTILLESTKNYPSKRLLTIKSEELYDCSGESLSYGAGKFSSLSFIFKFLQDKYVDENLFEEALAFIKEVLFNPDVKDGQFNDQSFRIAKNALIEDIESLPERTRIYSDVRMREEMDAASPIAIRNVGYMEGLDEINPTNLYEYYKSILNNDLVDIYIVGDIDFCETKKKITEAFVFKTIKKPSDNPFIIHEKYRYRAKKVIEESDNNQSRLLLGYKMKDLTPFERNYTIYLFSYILGGGGDSKLFKVVREKNSLCYNIFSSPNNLSNIFTIAAGLDYTEYEKALRLIKREVKKIQKGEFDSLDLDKAKAIYKSSCLELYENPVSIIRVYMSKEYSGSDLVEDRLKNIEKVTTEMIMQVAKKIYLQIVYVLKGEEHE